MYLRDLDLPDAEELFLKAKLGFKVFSNYREAES